MSENVYEMKEMAKNEEKIVRFGHFLLTKIIFFDFTESKWSE